MNKTSSPTAERRRSIASAVVAFGLVAAACGGGGRDYSVIALDSFDGGTTVTLDDFAGKPLVVNFWASWCPSCVAEMSAAFRPVQEQLGDTVTFVGVNIRDSRDKALKLLDETGVQWINVIDQDGSLYAELGGISMPFTVFISADGEIIDKHNGALSESLLRDRIGDKLLG